ncbi:hypothetical protein [Streptomyces sp. NPDC057623]|uniref:hypothetical protein n=1 Tax=Streptomyces sp. NPDC057623 TaxID=3346187 RepID=UPI0036C3A470
MSMSRSGVASDGQERHPVSRRDQEAHRADHAGADRPFWYGRINALAAVNATPPPQ